MLVNDTKEISHLGMPSQFHALPRRGRSILTDTLRLQVKQFRRVRTVLVTLNLLISGRGKVEFCNLLQGYRYTLLCLQSEACFMLACVKNCIDNLLALVVRQGLEGYRKRVTLTERFENSSPT